VQAKYLIPFGIFVILVGLFVIGLGLDPREVPSPLINKSAPQFELPRLHEPGQTIGRTDLEGGGVKLVNVWASWCTACRQEHPFLMELARRGDVPIYGLNYKDARPDALNWLKRLGDPYTANAFDNDGRVGIDWGVYGVPETFVVDGEGTIRYKHIGPLGPKAWRETVYPAIQEIREEQG